MEVLHTQVSPRLGVPEPLCSACDRLDLETMFCAEVGEACLGYISDYKDPSCSFCDLIYKSICRALGPAWSSSRVCSTTSTPPLLFIQSRSPLSVKHGDDTEHPQPRLLLAIDQKPPGFQHNRAPVRETDRRNDRFIIAEIESLPDDSESKKKHLLPRRKVGSHVDVALVIRWLQECKKHKHSRNATRRKGGTMFQREHPFRLIDVIGERLVEKTKRCDYVALSYVWGQIPTILSPERNSTEDPILLAVRENFRDLSAPESLTESRRATGKSGRVPRTVRDAMELTKKIGMRYLWVDTLCILQDDEIDKARLIGSIDDVYDNATVTVIAAAGSNADAGLRGISPRAGHPIKSVKVFDASEGITLKLSTCLPSICEQVRNSTWNTRGWTFQEQCLSQRCLYFTAEETFFNCIEAQWREGYDYGEGRKYEDLNIKFRTGPPWWGRKLRNDLDPTPYYYLGDVKGAQETQIYQRAVQDYSRRSLTYPKDVLSAFEGIFNRFGRSGNACGPSIRQTQGIPPHLLFQAILWFPAEDSRKRLCDSPEEGKSAEQFSTWSWASWTGPINFVFADSLWLSRNISQAPIRRVPIYVPIVRWYYGDPSCSFWSHNAWKCAYKAGDDAYRHVSEDFVRARTYLRDKTGVNVDLLLEESQGQALQNLGYGEIGFFGSYLSSSDFILSGGMVSGPQGLQNERSRTLKVSDHGGEFRFDGEVQELSELVPVVAANTVLSKPPYTQSILLGLATQNGVSTRVGIGFIFYSRNPASLKPQWKYKPFRIR